VAVGTGSEASLAKALPPVIDEPVLWVASWMSARAAMMRSAHCIPGLTVFFIPHG